MHVAAIIAAGGQGQRLGAEVPKQFLPIGGRTLLDYSVEAFLSCARVDEVVIALPPASMPEVGTSLGSMPRVSLVAGGARRQDSVENAFAVVAARADIVVVHDAARPFVTASLIERTIDAAAEHGAAIAAIRARDTVKQATAAVEDGPAFVQATLPRETIYLAQTPQAFRRDVLARAIDQGRAHPEATDEAMLAERAGFRVQLVDGDAGNIKVTTAEDLAVARLRLGAASEGATVTRIGTGYDLHRLVPGRPLVLAGVTIPFELGLDGHSDADIVCHAVTDAVLGAAAKGDVGRLFPDTDPAWKGADSVMLLGRAMDVVRAAGYAVVNVDVTVIAQAPKLLPYLDAMRANLAQALGCGADAVSVKGKTNERVDSMGRGESMACHAVALIART
jgi:2-C-methyl-D-erythritol 4-phosphate cytidylyltransferase / 2-C-methyl-D-erythritol 2,4-cyclodiphosphate synthase